jgi:threonine aldolase
VSSITTAPARTAPLIDLRSDVLARRTPEMIDAGARAEREGDFRFGLREDPRQLELERRCADLLGMEDALVFATCSMANTVAVLLHSTPGSRITTQSSTHVATAEASAAVAFGGVAFHTPATDDPSPPLKFWSDAVDQAADFTRPSTSMFLIENTHNRSGGVALAPDYVEAVTGIARARRVPSHLDGARLYNAAEAFGVPLKAFSTRFDSVALSLNKALGTPIAAVLAGSRNFIERAMPLRHRLGGGIRPTGPAAASSLAALDAPNPTTGVHALAARLADGLSAIPQLVIEQVAPRTNIVVCQVKPGSGITAATFRDHLASAGVLANALGTDRIRFVVYRGLGEADIDTALAILRDLAPRWLGAR